MRVSEVLSGSVETFLEMTPQMQDHLDSAENPHKVTKSQVGLGNVTDDKQATDQDFRSHKSDPVLDHPAGSVTTEKLQNGAVTREKIASGAVDSTAISDGSVGQTHLQEAIRLKIDGKVDKAEGMGLSQNSFTDAEKAKLGAIAVTDGTSLSIDTAALVLRNESFSLIKTGAKLIKEKESVQIPPNSIKQVLAASADLQSERTTVIGINDMNTLSVYFIEAGVFRKRHFATERDVCYFIDNDDVYFGELTGNSLHIRLFQTGANAWKSFLVKGDKNTALQDFHILKDRVVAIYTSSQNGGAMHVESFGLDGKREWEFVTGSALRENYEGTDVYKRRFPKSVMVGDDLYFAPVLDSTNGHSVLRLDRNGTLVKTYMPITNYSAGEDVLLGLTYSGGSLYGFVSDGYLVRIDTENGNTYKAYLEGAEAATLLGMHIGRGDRVVLYTQNAQTGMGRLYKIDGKTVDMEKDMVPEVELMTDVDASYPAFCIKKEGFEFFRYEENGTKGFMYRVADTFKIL